MAWLLVDIEKAAVFIGFSLDTVVGDADDGKVLFPPSCIVTNSGPCVIWCLFLTASSYFGGSRSGMEKNAVVELELSMLTAGCVPNAEVTWVLSLRDTTGRGLEFREARVIPELQIKLLGEGDPSLELACDTLRIKGVTDCEELRASLVRSTA